MTKGVGMEIRCEGGMLDGTILDQADPEPVIHQNGIKLLRAHEPYPKKKGLKVTERLLTYTEDYALTLTPEGPVYRVVRPFGGVAIGDETIAPSEGGAYDIYRWRSDGEWHAKPEGEAA